ncbi:MAG: hypothetical protein ACREHV_01055 [Rhizomicrobium sp.]
MKFGDHRPPMPPRPQRGQRFTWCKIPNDFCNYPVLRAAAMKAKAPVHQVVSVALFLECLANASEPRGSVADFSVAECAASLQLRPDVVAQIRVALEDPEIFWIDPDQDFLAGFQARNPESFDPTAVDRQRRHRAKLKAEREAVAAAARGPPYPQSRDVTRDTVTSRRDVTLRVEQIKKPLCREEGGAGRAVNNFVENSSREAAGLSNAEAVDASSLALDDQETAELWLASEGERLVVSQLQSKDRKEAAKNIDLWRDRKLGGDAVTLVRIIRGAVEAGSFGERFLNQVVDGVNEAARRANAQRELPIPPVPISERKLGW